MKRLLAFLVKYFALIVMVFYVGLSLFLLFKYNSFHRSKYLSSANQVMGLIMEQNKYTLGYLNLREINRELSSQITELAFENLRLKEELHKGEILQDTIYKGTKDTLISTFFLLPAKVINNSIIHTSNYITLDKGSMDGVVVDMGVVSHRGVVGIVTQVSDHYSLVIPLLNQNLRISCKIKGSDYFGSLVWRGGNPTVAQLQELPRHAPYGVGDTVVTSGFSGVFPAGIVVGTVVGYVRGKDDNFYNLEIRLSTDFSALSDVTIIKDRYQEEQLMIEKFKKK